MANYKKYEKDAEAIENRFNRNHGDAGETYKAMEEYRENMDVQKQELENMDPNSREYDKAQQSLDRQRNTYDRMKFEQKTTYSTDSIRDGQKDLANQNQKYAEEMDRAAQKGDVNRYEEYRSKYETNIKAQETMENQVIRDGQDTGNMQMDINQQRQYMFGKDCQMNENAKDPAVAEKYRDRVEQDKKDMLNSQHNRRVEQMDARNASAEEYAREQKEHEETMNNIHRY